MSKRELDALERLLQLEDAAHDFSTFVRLTMPTYQMNWHHRVLMDYLQRFAEGKIKKLMVFMPPQHGKSELVSRRLPAFLLGQRPTAKIIGCSYSADLATSFNREVQRIIDSDEYRLIFPETTLNGSNVRTAAAGNFLRNSDIFEVVKYKGFYKSVGLGGSLTGTPADIGIIDDPVKDALEADSETYRARAWDWFTNVFMTRMHNDSQVLVTQTRWNEDDLSGRILNNMKDWEVLSLPAIKEGAPTATDPRTEGQALWPERHSLERILEIKNSNERAFQALFQQDPRPFEKGLVFPHWLPDWRDGGQICYGLDFGFSPDPLALVEVRLQGDAMFIKEHIYRNNMSAEDIVNAVKAIVPRGCEVICDKREDLRADLVRNGVNAKSATKGAGSIDDGVKRMNNYRLHLHPESLNLQREFKYYKYKEDANGNPIGGAYTDKMNHAIDAARYAVLHMTTKAPAYVGVSMPTPKRLK